MQIKEEKKTYRGAIFPNKEERLLINKLMRKQSSCMRFAYKRLLEGYKRPYLKRFLQTKFQLNSRYVNDAIEEAKTLINSMEELGHDPKSIIFGGKKLFYKLKNKHFDSSKLEEIRTFFKEKRQLNLYSMGDSATNGNPNIKIEIKDSQIILRINLVNEDNASGEKWLKLPFFFDHKNRNEVLFSILAGFPYTMYLICRHGKYQVMPTITEVFPEPQKDFCKTMGIDLNAFPANIAWTIVNDKTGNPENWNAIPTPELFDQRSNKRDWCAWQYAHQLVDFAFINKCKIALENLNIASTKKNSRHSNHTRRKLNNFSWKSLLDKIYVLAKRKGVPVCKVKPYHTTTIGLLKYSPQYGMTRHNAAALVIARRALGLKEKLPRQIQKLTKNHLKKSIEKKEEKIKKLETKLKVESDSGTTLSRKSVRSQLNKVRQTLWKEQAWVNLEVNHPQKFNDLAIWKVAKTAVLTALSTGGKPVLWGRLNPSTLRKLSFFKSHGRGNNTNVAIQVKAEPLSG